MGGSGTVEEQNQKNREKLRNNLIFDLILKVLARIDVWNHSEIKFRVFWTGQTLISMEFDQFHATFYFALTFQKIQCTYFGLIS